MVAQGFFAARVSGTAGGTVVRTWVNPIGADTTAWGTPDWTSSVNPGGDAADSGQAIWGAGSKGVTFLNTLELGSRVVCAIDINERKHGRFVPGSGQEVVPPERAVELGAGVVLIMNPLYRDEIRQQLASLGAAPEIAVV